MVLVLLGQMSLWKGQGQAGSGVGRAQCWDRSSTAEFPVQGGAALQQHSVNILVGLAALWQHKLLPLQLRSNSQRQARKTGDSNYIKQTFSLSAETFGFFQNLLLKCAFSWSLPCAGAVMRR